MMKRNLLVLSLSALCLTAMAVPAKRGLWRTIKLQDGTEVRAMLKGDEHAHFYVDANGDKYQRQGDFFVNIDDFSEIAQRASARRAPIAKSRARRLAQRRAFGEFNTITGAKKGLIILAQFTDKKFQTGHDQALYNKIANQEGYSEGDFKGSVADYFKAQSGGLFTLNFDVYGPVTVSKNMKYYGGNDRDGNDLHPEQMVVEAVNLVKNQVDWAQYDWDGDGEIDQVMVIYAGEGEASSEDENTIWPHEWELEAADAVVDLGNGLKVNTYAVSNEVTSVGWFSSEYALDGIGTICHEFSHCLGLPDMYDTSYSGNFGMGAWSLMDQGSYNGDGYVPAGYSSFDKLSCGWIEPKELTVAADVEGLKALSEGGDAYLIKNGGNANEYYLLENRQQTGWDEGVPSAGMLIIHVDYDKEIWANNLPNTTISNAEAAGYGYSTGNDHQRCTIFHADSKDLYNYYYEKAEEAYSKGDAAGYYEYIDLMDEDAANDTYPQESNNELTNTSTPRAFTYNKNTDGRKLMNVSITGIRQNADGTIAFKFAPDNSGSGTEGDNTDYGNGTTNPGTEQPEKPTVEGALFYESFDSCDGKGGNDGEFGGSSVGTKAFAADNAGWVANEDKMYGADKCAKFGTGKVVGEATTPEFEIDGECTLTFNAAAFGTDKTDLMLSVTGNATLDKTEVAMGSGQWAAITATLSGKGKVKITFTPAKRMLLDEVLVMPKGDLEGISATLNNRDQLLNNKYFNLSGQRVETPTAKGVYIINGRKVVK